jgi:hypothetical protein
MPEKKKKDRFCRLQIPEVRLRTKNWVSQFCKSGISGALHSQPGFFGSELDLHCSEMSKCVGFFIGKNGVECRVIDRF